MTRPIPTPALSTSHAFVADVPKPATMDHTAVVWTEHIDGHAIVRVHSSGAHLTASVADVVDYTATLVAKYRPAVLTTTESTQHGLVAALRKRLGRGYAIRKSGQYLCIVDRAQARHRVRRPKLVRLTDIPGLRQDWRNLFVGDFRVKLLEAPDVQYVVTVGHVASGVQDGDRYRTDRPAMVLANREGLEAWGRYLDQLPHDAVCSAAMDSNLDSHRDAWRARIEQALGGSTIWDEARPAAGSHGRRLIDTAVLRAGGSTAAGDTLTVLAWNVYVGHKPAAVRRELEDMIAAHDPDAVVLTEAVHQQASLRGLGYQVVHLPSKALRKGNQPETADTAILVKASIRLLRHWAMRMTTFWKGPDHGWPHDPRVYQAARIRKGAQSWRLLGDHQPFGAKAVAETVARIGKWLRAAGRIPSIAIGDQNMRTREFHDRVAADAGAQVGGHRIDLAAYRGCELVSVEDLGAHGSDHHAYLYTFRVTPKETP